MLSKGFYSLKKRILIYAFTAFIYACASAQPNIIYIMTDDMGYGDLSSYGRKEYQTPNIDKLASQGMKFVNAYSAAPICTPTRTAFMTGRYPARTPVGLIEPLTGDKKDVDYGLTSQSVSIATLLKEAGYETALIGKWHLGLQPAHNPTSNGFDYFFGILSGASDYISHKAGGPGNRRHDLYENNTPVDTEGYLTELFAEKAISFLKNDHVKPFFLSIMFNAPHWPWIGPGDKAYDDSVDFRKGGSPAIYSAMMKSLDDAIGRIMNAIDKQQLTKETLVIFTNDNGGERYSDNGGYKNGKGTLWEGGIRVPAFIRWPGKINSGTTTGQLAITMDWPATILSAARLGNKAPNNMDGTDLLPILTGKQKNIDRTFYWRTFQRTRHKAIREGNWKYLQDEKGEFLFNLLDDPKEQKDLKELEVAEFDRLKKKYADWEKTVLSPVAL